MLWQRRLHERGWGGMGWPEEFGGPGWNSVQQYIFEEESALAGASAPDSLRHQDGRAGHHGLRQRRPTAALPAEDQRRGGVVVPGLFGTRGRLGSGVAEDPRAFATAITTSSTARRPGTPSVNTPIGSFVWCAPTRQAKQQSGITFLLIDMKSPGITVRPITLLDGGHEVNEVWFEDVRVPVENRIGEENRGWTYAKFLLGHERTNIAGIGIAKRELARLKRIAARRAPAWPAADRGSACSPRRSRRSKSTCGRWRSPICACCPRSAARRRRVPRRRFSRSGAPRSSRAFPSS